MNDLIPKTLHETRSCGALGELVITIAANSSKVDLDNLPEEHKKRIRYAAYDAHRLMENAITDVILACDPEAQRRAQGERKGLLDLFEQPIWVEDIPNQYDNGPWGKHRPWFKVTTVYGIFIIGWRKRVISIDWSGVPNSKTAEDLFPNEDVTKTAHSIHAWGYDKAAEYLQAIISSLPQGTSQ